MLFVVHALDKKDILPTRAKHYRDHRIHLDRAVEHGVDVVTAGTLVADDGETPVGSIFVIDADGPRRGRCVYAQRSVSPQRRVGARLHPRLQQEARHPDCEPALTGSARPAGQDVGRLACLRRACSISGTSMPEAVARSIW